MHKKIIQYANEHGMMCGTTGIYGSYNGYQVTVDFGPALSTMFTVSFSVNLGDRLNEFLAYLEPMKSFLKFTQILVDGCSIYCSFQNMTLGSSLKKADTTLQTVTARFREMGISENHCPYCGQPLDKNASLVNDRASTFYAHGDCFNNRVESVVQLEQDEASLPNNYLMGTLGALIGAVVGGILYVVLFFIGILASISSLVGAYLGAFLFTKFGGKNSKTKIVIVAICTLVVIAIAFSFGTLLDAAAYIEYYQINSDALLTYNDGEFKAALISNLLYTVIFYVLSIVVAVIDMVRQQKKLSSTMRKYN